MSLAKKGSIPWNKGMKNLPKQTKEHITKRTYLIVKKDKAEMAVEFLKNKKTCIIYPQ